MHTDFPSSADAAGSSGSLCDSSTLGQGQSAADAQRDRPSRSEPPADRSAPLEDSARPLDVEQHVRDVVEQLTDPDRPATLNAAKTFERSTVFWTALAPAKRELVDRVLRDRALNSADCVTTFAGLIDGYAEARLFRMSMFMRLTEGDTPGPLTNKGKTKALYRAYVSALDREMKLAQLIGLDRVARPVQTNGDITLEDGSVVAESGTPHEIVRTTRRIIDSAEDVEEEDDENVE